MLLLLLWRRRRLRKPARGGQEGRMHLVVETRRRRPLQDLCRLRGAVVRVRTTELILEHDRRRSLSPDRWPRGRMPISLPLALEVHLGIAIRHRGHRDLLLRLRHPYEYFLGPPRLGGVAMALHQLHEELRLCVRCRDG